MREFNRIRLGVVVCEKRERTFERKGTMEAAVT